MRMRSGSMEAIDPKPICVRGRADVGGERVCEGVMEEEEEEEEEDDDDDEVAEDGGG